ncbi:MAG: hypothetical protein HW386_1160, partial [Gammaproteobacteria bacterium]|nr:hypothetical protein [Gammaproteobacteria bacterium]
MEFDKLPCSFRDPSGFLFRKDDVLYRQINSCYKDNYQTLKNSGLYTDLIDKGLLVTHEEVKVEPEGEHGYLTIRPDELPFISYPYEWSFSQLKESALLTLKIQQLAMNKGFSLKDASSYNVQLQRGKPIFIDTLSFEKLNPSEPWIAYKQFCQHFLAPLALMAKKDISLNQLLRTNIDGIPLLLASKLLPLRTRMNFSLAIHLHLHARMQSKFADQDLDVIKHRKKFSRNSLNGIIDSLVTAVSGLNWQPKDTEWHDYYDSNNNYNNEALLSKEIIVREFLDKQSNRSTWDLGANTGRFSRLAAQYSEYVCAWDIDPACVEINYRTNCKNGVGNVYPLLLDLTNPSPAIGWNNCERAALKERGPADLTLALGIIHHLSIANNLSFEMIASFLADITHTLIIEFIQKTDSQVKKLLRNRTDIFPEYNQDNFEHVFSEYFNTLGKK